MRTNKMLIAHDSTISVQITSWIDFSPALAETKHEYFFPGIVVFIGIGSSNNLHQVFRLSFVL